MKITIYDYNDKPTTVEVLDDSQIIDLYDGLDCKALNTHCGLF